MDDRTTRDLLLRLGSIEDLAVKNRVGVVTATSPLTVRVAGGAPIPNVRRIKGAALTVGDHVLCQMWQSVLIVIGVIE